MGVRISGLTYSHNVRYVHFDHWTIALSQVPSRFDAAPQFQPLQ